MTRVLRSLLLSCLAFAFTTICSPQESSSGYMDGNMLLEKCESASPSVDKTECFGYVAGVMDASATMLNSLRAATPTPQNYRKLPRASKCGSMASLWPSQPTCTASTRCCPTKGRF